MAPVIIEGDAKLPVVPNLRGGGLGRVGFQEGKGRTNMSLKAFGGTT